MTSTKDRAIVVSALKHAAPYIRLFKGKVFVLKAGGEIFADPAQTRALMEQVGILHQVGIRVVLIHGGGPQSTQLATALGLDTTFVDGRRVTDGASLDVATMVLNGQINTRVLAACRDLHIPAVGISGVDAGLIGQFIEVRATLARDPGIKKTPVLSDLTIQCNQDPDCSEAYADPDCLWPPNNKMVPVNILGVTDPDGDPVTIVITGITSDEATATEKGAGGPKHAPDADGIGTDTAELRSERSGKGNGRVYEISFIALDGEGGECEGSVAVCVPHDQSGEDCECIDDGQIYDATQIN